MNFKEIMTANLLLLVPPLLAFVTLVLAYMVVSEMQKSATLILDEAESLKGRLKGLRRNVAKLPSLPIASNVVEEHDPVPDPLTPAAPVELSPLETLRGKGFDWLNRFDAGLQTCASRTGLSVSQLTTEVWQPARIAAWLNEAQSERALLDVNAETIRLAVEIVKVLVSKSDHDLDAERSDGQLQRAIDSLASLAVVRIFRPEIGEPVDKVFHISLGVGGRAGEHSRGTVASVRARGLLDARNAVIARAEIREFD
ncbi:hypothetical protein [Granulicella arctica]|uniref:hypothetical protein n=1 Tax=Granulicella arctica TaxID=940613 RepID=UPI0021DFCFB6|nr:hypothetical protein [Granulicella arctica]